MSVGNYAHVTRASGTILTAAIYNSDHVNHITNQNPQGSGGYDDVTQMQATIDPGLAGFEVVPASIYEILKQHEFILQRLGGGAYWGDYAGVPVGPGNVVGPASPVTDEEYVIFDGVTGLIIQGGKLTATAANVRAAVTDTVIESDLLELAAAFVALTETAGAVAVDWDTFINATVTVDQNSVISNPTNGQPGTWRFIIAQGNDGTDRTLTFGNQFGGDLPSITNMDNLQKYILAIFCKTATQFLVFAADGSDA